MSEVVLDNEVLALVPEERRELVARVIARTPYTAPVVASYSMDSLTLSPRAVIVISNGTAN